jgi:uncharacterized membrane protein
VDIVFGLPSHPLFVHLPLVAVPAAALAALAIALRPAWRRRFGLAATALTAVGFVGTFLATQSGEELYDAIESRIGDVADRHQELGEQTLMLVAAFFLTMVGSVVADHRLISQFVEQRGFGRHVATALTWIGAVVGAVATVWMLRTGHEGARLVWEDAIP